MTQSEVAGTTLRFGFYTDTFMYRSEVFFYRQAVGMRQATVQVLARQGALLDEFPVDDLFLVDEYRHLRARLWSAAARRLDRSTESPYSLRPYAARRVANQLRHNPVDVMYCFFGWHAAQILDVLDYLDEPVPLVFTAAGSDINAPDLIGTGYRSKLQNVFERSERVLCLSLFLQTRVIELGADPRKVICLYPGVEIPQEEKSATSSQESAKFLAVSRIDDWKGVPHTIRAFSHVARSVGNASLEIIGDGSQLEECKRLATQLGLDDRVLFRGSRSIGDVYEAMAQADVFLTHSIRNSKGQEEGLGISVIEAMAHGLPIVGTRSGGIPETVVPGETGYLVRPGDEAGMAEAMARLARDPELRHKMGIAGRHRAMREFDIHKQNEKLESILTEVALEHRGAHA